MSKDVRDGKLLSLGVVLALLAGCTTATPHGPCVGLNGTESSKLEYKYSAWNIGLAVLFSGLILPPIFVVLDELKCPVGPKVTP